MKHLYGLKQTLLIMFSVFLFVWAKQGMAASKAEAAGKEQVFKLQNDKVTYSVVVNRDGILESDRLQANVDWATDFGVRSFSVSTDADYLLKFMWTAWSAPGKPNNAQNLLNLDKTNFKFDHKEEQNTSSGAQELDLVFNGMNTSLQVRVRYQLEAGKFYARRKVEVRAAKQGSYEGEHYLRKIFPLDATISDQGKIRKEGGFGQPAALWLTETPGTGAFFGMEYPTTQNELRKTGRGLHISCGDFIGKRVDDKWYGANWVVEGLSPEPEIKQWFMKYVDDIRAKPLRPYLLYNSWYDLEAPQMVDDPDRVMNEKNVLRSIQSFDQRLTQQRGIKLDAFVLDDGWDVYRSDWQLSKKQFPHGFKPIVDKLDNTDTDLGIWFGPIGGYSHRDWRLNWMREHGFETIGNQLCIAAKNYHKLLKTRVDNFVDNDHVGYYKWDGIQFSCSNPSHGHPVGEYSRRAIMDSVIDLSHSVWERDPHAFLNVTSGTWLSPWWVKYSNTIWMQGGDYGYTNIPSISHRDRAITYRDFVLYEDMKKKDLWFPISNLMTHGIIKGHLQQLAQEEPLDKFTDNALLYFARGVSMWELYISPDLLTDAQWDMLAGGIKWARQNFDLLQHTEMIGGDPGEGDPYGYAHFKGDHGIVIARNPVMSDQSMKLQFTHGLGLDKDADSLVVERVYPNRWISPVMESAGSALDIDLRGYETAIYEIYPVKEARVPLLAGADFEIQNDDPGDYQINVLSVDPSDGGGHLLNPDIVASTQAGTDGISPEDLDIPAKPPLQVVQQVAVKKQRENQVQLDLNIDPGMDKATFAVLLKTQNGVYGEKKANPNVTIRVDGQKQEVDSEIQNGGWGWYKVPVSSGQHAVEVRLDANENLKSWEGSTSFWLSGNQKTQSKVLSFRLKSGIKQTDRILPPIPTPKGKLERDVELGTVNMKL